MSTSKRLTQVLQSAKVIPFDDSSKFILFSDCHRGDNSAADDFAHNQHIFFFALQHYFNRGFTYIELGDGDELWENRRFSDIRNAHDNVFHLLSKFHQEGRFHFIWGNHNREWSKERNVHKHLHTYQDRNGEPQELFDEIEVHEGLVLEYKAPENRILLTHGHQGQLLNDGLWWLGRYIVRFAWRPLQLLGVKDPTSPAKNFKIAFLIEGGLTSWARDNHLVLIAGHTHRSIFPNLDDHSPAYFNTGSCVHPRCITGIKIEEGKISLIKWWPQPDENGFLCLKEQPVREETKDLELKSVFAKIKGISE